MYAKIRAIVCDFLKYNFFVEIILSFFMYILDLYFITYFYSTILIKKLTESLINKSFPLLLSLLKFGKSSCLLNLFCLSFMRLLPLFYFNCIIYFGFLIFCCQSVAIWILYIIPYNNSIISEIKYS